MISLLSVLAKVFTMCWGWKLPLLLLFKKEGTQQISHFMTLLPKWQAFSLALLDWTLMTVLLLKSGTSFLKCVNRVIGFDALHSTSVEWKLTTWFQTTCTRNKGCEGTYINQKSTSLVRTQWFLVSPDFCKCFSST